MKTKLCIGIMLLAATLLPAQTNNLTALLQQGLFEEQASRNLDAAIADYSTLAAQFDKDRQLAATAVFRLGECYRAQGRTNEAAVQYGRILRDFSDQSTLATLSRQDLAGMGMAKIETGQTEVMAPAVENADAQLLKKLEGRSQDELEKILPTIMPNATLDALIKERSEAQIRRASLVVDYSPQSIDVLRVDALLTALNKQIADTISGMMQGLKLRAEISAAAPAKKAELLDLSVPASSEEDQQIAHIQQMIQNSPDLINAPAEGSDTPLQTAAGAGQLKVVNFLLDHGAEINGGRFSALNRAAGMGNRAMVELLLRRGARVDAPERDGQTALHHAAARGYLSVTETLLAAKAAVNALDVNKATPLTLAVENNAVAVAAALLAQGADPNNICGPEYANDRENKGTPLHIAVIKGNEAMVALLLTNHADLTLRNPMGESALEIAAILGKTGIARQLIDAGADVNAVGPERVGSFTPLHRAAGAGAAAIVTLLLEHGANPNVPAALSQSRATPLMTAVLSDKPEVVAILLKHKAAPNVVDSAGNTPLVYALDRRTSESARALLAAGANPDAIRYDGFPAIVLVVAANTVDVELLKSFIKAGANVNATDRDGKAALHWAADKNRKDLVELLVQAGADVNLRTKSGLTPLNYAKSHSGPEGMPGSSQLNNVNVSWQLVVADGQPGATNEASVADFLRQHGALDALPDFTRIRITRQGIAQPLEVFRRASKQTNQFTLLETVMRFYTQSQVLISGQGNREAYHALPFPDLGRIIIRRPGQKIGGKELEIKVSLLNHSNVVDCAQDVPVEFGDVIEIPESIHALNENPPDVVSKMTGRHASFAERLQAQTQPDLKANPYAPAMECLQKSVQLLVAGETATLKVDSWDEGFLSQALNKTEARSILRTSSDLSRVKITRKAGKSAKPVIYTVDLSENAQSDNAFWLQDGDIIEVPEKL
ncbi:MAG: ankyrin repeat domain-containing protein [Verrucomicrobiae bacterium]|nr:ankyrin repeat domain-containing protein [Verrucomicrobiae bacterium]